VAYLENQAKLQNLIARLIFIRASARPMAVFSGLYESPGPPRLGDARGIVPPLCDDHRNGHQSGYILHYRAKLQNLIARLIFIRASARPMAVFSDVFESPGPPQSGDVSGIVPPHRDDHRNRHQSGYILHYRCVYCLPGGRRGDTERVVAQWLRSVASGEALVMLHWAMRSVSHRRTAMAIEMARDGGTFVRRRCLFRLL
jgi:hypothetical protein